jgi:cytochrome c nitrite reductase small subunit
MRAGFTIATLPAALFAATLGAAAGLGGFAFVHGRGASYLTDEPRVCTNCHVMQSYYDAWLKSSHHAVATCNDCHTPAEPIEKGLVKATNGLRHSVAFTAGTFPDSLQARPQDVAVLEQQCRRCHADALLAMPQGGTGTSCIRCHDSVGHLL